ncbi:MAG TPA: hypothetical protein VMX55_10310 [candidate division Zixibacteria bacterium]|nr:hypothetical protein [candidate division Zixibacteria bacterium]
MIISCSEIEIILNELLANKNKELTLTPFFKEEKIFSYDLENKKLHLKTNPHSWKIFIDFLCSEYALSNDTRKELPEFDDIKKAVVSAGLLIPEGIDVLIDEIRNYLTPIKRMNRRKRFLIALDTNQLIDNLMSNYVEKEFATKEQLRNFISYIISSWVLSERDTFIRDETNRRLVELNSKLKEWDYFLPEKIDRKARLGYSIYSELKSLEESYVQLGSRIKSDEKNEIMKSQNLKDSAIIGEYEDYIKSLKDFKFIYVTSDDQSFALAKDRFESIKVKVVNTIPNTLDCSFENGAKLIYQLTLFLGFLRIDSYDIRFNIYYKGKEHDDWENKRLEFLCSDKEFEKSISKFISIVRKLNEF